MGLLVKKVDQNRTAFFRGYQCVGLLTDNVFEVFVNKFTTTELSEILKFHNPSIVGHTIASVKPLIAKVAKTDKVETFLDQLKISMAEVKKNAYVEPIKNVGGPGPINNIRQTPNNIAGKRIVITGTIPHYTRLRLRQLVEGCGATLQNDVGASTDFLVVGNTRGEVTQKQLDAITHGTHTMNAEAFLRFIGR